MTNFSKSIFLNYLEQIVKIDSVSSYYEEIQEYIVQELQRLGFAYELFYKGGVVVHVNSNELNKLAVLAHTDTIGMMVRDVNSDGTMSLLPVGGLSPVNEINQDVMIHTLDDRKYAATIYKRNASVHLSPSSTLSSVEPDDCIAILHENSSSASDTLNMGIRPGDIVAPTPRFRVLNNGIIQSRFLDDKGSVAILLTILNCIHTEKLRPHKNVDFYFTMFEETGHGGSVLREDVRDAIAIEMAPVGKGQHIDVHKIAISPRFGSIISNRSLTKALVNCANKNNIPYILAVSNSGGTDCSTAIVAGHDVRHTVIGFGTFASHGYELTHIDSLKAMYDLLIAYILQ